MKITNNINHFYPPSNDTYTKQERISPYFSAKIARHERTSQTSLGNRDVSLAQLRPRASERALETLQKAKRHLEKGEDEKALVCLDSERNYMPKEGKRLLATLYLAMPPSTTNDLAALKVLASMRNAERSADDDVLRGDIYMRLGDSSALDKEKSGQEYLDAVKCFSHAIEKEPNHAKYLAKKAFGLWKYNLNGKGEKIPSSEICALCCRALELDPENQLSYAILQNNQNIEKADTVANEKKEKDLDFYTTAYALCPEDVEYAARLASCYCQNNENNQALLTWQKFYATHHLEKDETQRPLDLRTQLIQYPLLTKGMKAPQGLVLRPPIFEETFQILRWVNVDFDLLTTNPVFNPENLLKASKNHGVLFNEGIRNEIFVAQATDSIKPLGLIHLSFEERQGKSFCTVENIGVFKKKQGIGTFLTQFALQRALAAESNYLSAAPNATSLILFNKFNMKPFEISQDRWDRASQEKQLYWVAQYDRVHVDLQAPENLQHFATLFEISDESMQKANFSQAESSPSSSESESHSTSSSWEGESSNSD